MIPSINNSNKTKKLKHNKHEHVRSKIKRLTSSSCNEVVTAGSKRKKVGPKKERPLSHRAESRRAWPLLSQVHTYFIEQKGPLLEAEKFFNCYSSNGWLLGSKTPMRSWKAASKNWILNCKILPMGKKSAQEDSTSQLIKIIVNHYEPQFKALEERSKENYGPLFAFSKQISRLSLNSFATSSKMKSLRSSLTST